MTLVVIDKGYFLLYVLRDYFKAEYILHNMQYIVINNISPSKYSTKPTTEKRIS